MTVAMLSPSPMNGYEYAKDIIAATIRSHNNSQNSYRGNYTCSTNLIQSQKIAT